MRRRDPAYAFGLQGIQKAPWRPEMEQAYADALDAGYGYPGEHGGGIYLHVFAEIWTTHDLVPVLPRKVTLPKENGPTSDRPLTRIERIIARREAQERAVSG